MIKAFTIDRSRWLNGHSNKVWSETSTLCSYTDKQCCMGFYAEACGVPRERLKGCGALAQLFDSERAKIHEELSSQLAYDFYATNDAKNMSRDKREQVLTKRFKDKLGVKVKFVGRYPKKPTNP